MKSNFEMAVEMYNSGLMWEEKGYRIIYEKDKYGEHGQIVLSNLNGIDSYILSLKDEELNNIVNYFKDLKIEIKFNNMCNIFREKKKYDCRQYLGLEE